MPGRPKWERGGIERQFFQHLCRPEYIAILALFLSLLAGQFSPDRLSSRFHVYGFAGYPSFWLLVLALVFLASEWRKMLAVSEKGLPLIFLACVVGLHCYLCLSVIWAPQPAESLSLVPPLLKVSVTLGLTLLLFSHGTSEKIEFTFCLVFLAALVYAFGGWIGGGTDDRIAAFGGGPNVFVRVVSSGLFMSYYFWIRTGQIRWLVPVPLLVATMLGSGSRGGILAFLIAFVITVLMTGIWIRASKVIAACAIVVGLSSVFWLLFVDQDYYSYLYERFIVVTIGNLYLSTRDEFLWNAWETIKTNPFWGVGLDGYRQIFGGYFTYPHNLFLQVQAEGGIIATMLLLSALLTTAIRWWLRKTLEAKVAFGLAIMYLLASQLSGGIYDARCVWFFLALYMLPSGIQEPMVLSSQAQRPQSGL